MTTWRIYTSDTIETERFVTFMADDSIVGWWWWRDGAARTVDDTLTAAARVVERFVGRSLSWRDGLDVGTYPQDRYIEAES